MVDPTPEATASDWEETFRDAYYSQWGTHPADKVALLLSIVRNEIAAAIMREQAKFSKLSLELVEDGIKSERERCVRVVEKYDETVRKAIPFIEPISEAVLKACDDIIKAITAPEV